MEQENPNHRLSLITTPWSLVGRANHGLPREANAARQQLLERYGPAVHRYLRNVLHDPHAVDEIFQEFALQLIHGKLRGADQKRGRFRYFVKGTLYHLIADYRKQQRDWPGPLPADIDGLLANPDDVPAKHLFEESWCDELLARAWEALAAIEASTGQPIHSVLRFRADHPEMRSPQVAEELSTRLGKALTAVGVRQTLHRAREKFAALLLDEVIHSLEHPGAEQLEEELVELGLLDYCRPALEQRFDRVTASSMEGVLLMPNDIVSRGGAVEGPLGPGVESGEELHTNADSSSAQFAASDESSTGFSPPFRVRLTKPIIAVKLFPVVPGEPACKEDDDSSEQANSVGRPAIPGYEIGAELGRGGMGVVYQARHRALKRVVALKMILAGLHADSTARMRFRTEAEAVARLQHPNIVGVYEVGEYDGRPFLALEYIDGVSLERKVAGTAQPERESAGIVETLARAVHYTHERGILHRDLKPSNILLTVNATPKITDFGLAKVLDSDVGPTRSGTFLGTPCYMAPEQAAGDATKIGTAADVYSLGAILYELMTGRPPFQGTSPLHILVQVRSGEPVPPRRLRPCLSADLETICLKCLEKEPAKRYPSAAAMADDLRCFLEDQPIRARPVSLWQRLCRSVRRRPARVAWALAAASLICLLLTVWSGFGTADQRNRYRAEEKYQRFVQHRNEALVHGLLAPEEGGLFLGSEAAAHVKTAEAAARKALALAGMKAEAETSAFDPDFPAPRKAEAAADCYALLMVLASITGQQSLPDAKSKERYQEALRILDRARDLGFHTRTYHLRRANFLELLGQPQEARKDRERAAALPPEGVLDHFLAGEEHYRRGEWLQAGNSFDRALTVQPGHFWAQFFLAICHLKMRQWEAAKAGLTSCLAQQHDFVWAYLFRSFANEKLQARAEVEADFQKALQLEPSDDARYVLFLTRGILHFNQRELEHAAADFRSAMTLKPEQYNAYLNLAQVCLAQGQFEEAAWLAGKAMRLRPPVQVVAGYHVERGRNLLREKRYEEAVKTCEAASVLCPDHPLPHEVLGRALLELDRAEEAERSFDQYLRKGGEDKSDIFRGRGLARMKLGRYPEAAEDYTRALERVPDADAYQHRGWAHYFSDAWKLAVRDFSRAIELNPKAGDARIGRGLARVMLGQYRGAVDDAESALTQKPSTPEMMHNIACIFAQAIVRAEGDLQEKDRQALADGYRERALKAVYQTLAMLPLKERSSFWQEKIQSDEALKPIRSNAKFRRLQAAYGRHP